MFGARENRSSWLPSGLGTLAYRDYRLIWTGQVISNIGSSMQQLGLGWLIVQLAERDGAGHLVPVYLGLVGLSVYRERPALHPLMSARSEERSKAGECRATIGF